MMMNLDACIAVLRLSHAGCLAVAFGGKHPTVGFDIRQSRIVELRRREDRTLETYPEEAAVYDAMVLPVAHEEFRESEAEAIAGSSKTNAIVCDLLHLLNTLVPDLRT